MRKDGIETVAAIDVGSNSIRMVIAQIKSDGSVEILEELNKPTDIGRDTFSTGRIEVETIYEVSDILKGYSNLMNDYKIKTYHAVSTSGIREAQNRQFVLEQIRIRTGILVDIISSAEERFYSYKVLQESLPDIKKLYEEGSLIIDIGSGGVEISVYQNGKLKFTHNVKVGSLRLREMLSDLEKLTLDFPSILEEFIDSKIYMLKPIIKKLELKNFIVLGGEIRFLAKDFIKKSDFKQIYSSIKSMTSEKIKHKYKLPEERAELLLPSVIICNSFLNMTKADTINIPRVSLRHGLLADIVDERFDTPRKMDFLNDIESVVWNIAKKYKIDEKHTAYVEDLALFIFDSTWRVHRMEERDRLYLRVASILHDIGKYININNHDIHGYNIIKNENIMGFSKREMNLIANIARYHSEDNPDHEHENYGELYYKDKIKIAKLSAILKLTEGLDISHKQKIEKFEITTSGKEIIFRYKSSEDTLLEEWSFSKGVSFFEEVMGYRPVMKRKG